MITFPIQPSNLLVTSNVHLVYFISFYLANCFPWMPGASRTHQSHIHRLMAHSAWSLDGANPGAQDPCLRCSLQTHLHYKKHYALYTSLYARIWLTRDIIYTYIFIYRKYTRNLFKSPVCCFIAATFASSTALRTWSMHHRHPSPSQNPVGCSTGGSTWKIRSIPASPSWSKVFRKSIRILEDERTLGVFGGHKKISVDFQGKTPWKTRGWWFKPVFHFLVGFEKRSTCHVMLCRLVKKNGSMTSGSKDQFGILPSWSSIKNPFDSITLLRVIPTMTCWVEVVRWGLSLRIWWEEWRIWEHWFQVSLA